jgi:hypothetical protein
MTRPTRTCVRCGGPFEASRADYTVRCPECRRAVRAPAGPPPPTRRDLDVMEARAAARTARRLHGIRSPEYAAAVAAYERLAGPVT